MLSLAVHNGELVGNSVVLNHVDNILCLFHGIEVGDDVDLGMVIHLFLSLELFGLLGDFFHKGLVRILGVFKEGDGTNNSVEASLAIEHTE